MYPLFRLPLSLHTLLFLLFRDPHIIQLRLLLALFQIARVAQLLRLQLQYYALLFLLIYHLHRIQTSLPDQVFLCQRQIILLWSILTHYILLLSFQKLHLSLIFLLRLLLSPHRI